MYYLFLANGFEITEAMAPLDIMRRAGLDVKTVGVTGGEAQSSHGITVKADISLDEVSYDGIEGAILPEECPEPSISRRATRSGRAFSTALTTAL